MSAPKASGDGGALRTGFDTARDQQFNMGHVAELLASQAREAGTECAGARVVNARDMERRWLRIEYLTGQLAGHVADLARGLDGVEPIADRTRRAAP